MKIHWTDFAKDDLRRIREYLKEHHGADYAKKVTREIKCEVESLNRDPNKSTFVKELEDLNLTQFKQLLAGQNRIIIEKASIELVYVHLVCHTTRDLETILRRRLLTP